MKKRLIELTDKKGIACLLFIGLLLICFNSCTKTETIDYEPEPKNRILTYKVRNTPHEILGAINQKQNTIDVRLPYYLGLDYVLADITLDPGATLLDIDSVEINLLEDELQAVALGDTIRYIVKSEDNKYRTYTITQEYTPHRDPLELTLKINNTSGSGKPYNGEDLYQRVMGSSLQGAVTIIGNFNSLSMESLKVTFTNQVTGEKVAYTNPQMNLDTGEDNYELDLGWLQGAPLGFFDVHVAHQGREADVQIGLAIAEHQMPTTNNLSGHVTFSAGELIPITNAARRAGPFDYTFKVGESITRTLDDRYQGATAFVGVKRVYLKVDPDVAFTRAPAGFVEEYAGKEVDLEITKSDLFELSFRFPDLPEGVYEIITTTPGTQLATPFNVYIEYERDAEKGIAWGKDNLTWSFGGVDYNTTTRIRTLRFNVTK